MKALRRAFKPQNVAKDQSRPNTERLGSNLDENWEVLENEPKPAATLLSDAALSSKSSSMSSKEIRQKFKESQTVKATIPLHTGYLTNEQILEVNFMAGVIVDRNPDLQSD